MELTISIIKNGESIGYEILGHPNVRDVIDAVTRLIAAARPKGERIWPFQIDVR